MILDSVPINQTPKIIRPVGNNCCVGVEGGKWESEECSAEEWGINSRGRGAEEPHNEVGDVTTGSDQRQWYVEE